MTEEQERQVVALLRRHQMIISAGQTNCDCGWWEQDGFDIADHQARLIRNMLGHQ